MAGGMNRRREDRPSLHERIHGEPPPRDDDPPPPRPSQASTSPIRHCWVVDDQGRQPALLLEWRRVASGWQGRVVRPVREEPGWIVVEEWLPAHQLQAAEA